MRWIKGAILGLLCLMFLFVGVMFTINNTQMVAVDLVLIKLPEASLSLWLVATFILGRHPGDGYQCCEYLAAADASACRASPCFQCTEGVRSAENSWFEECRLS